MSDWQPIETAPRDGTYILLWARTWRHSFAGQYYGDAFTVWVDIPTATGTKEKVFASHWMPLPEPPAKFRKRPVVIEAFQMTEARRNDNSEWPDWLNQAWQMEPGEGSLFIDAGDPARQRLVVSTPEGVYRVIWNDWIIRDIKGGIYTCKPDIFEATYEPVDRSRNFKERWIRRAFRSVL